MLGNDTNLTKGFNKDFMAAVNKERLPGMQ
jgi:hypothetical protein